MKYTHILAEFCTRAWAIREETLSAMTDLLRLQVTGVKWSQSEIVDRIQFSNDQNGTKRREENAMKMLPVAFDDDEGIAEGDGTKAASGRGAAARGTVALIPIIGIISHRMNMMGSISGPGGTSIQKLTSQFRAALDDGNCKAIVFDVDSPGGSVEGVMELASEIYAARKQKKIIAVCNSMACSAAYWLASSASEIVCTPSGQAGSIGVYMVHQDESQALEKEGIKITLIKAGRFKTEGDSSQPLTDEAREGFQGKVDAYYGMFVKGVAQNRGSSQEKVRGGFGEGRSLLAQDALKAHLVDRVATLDAVLAQLGVKTGANPEPFGSEDQPASHAADRTAKLEDRTKPDDDDRDDYCGCQSEACQGCTGGCKGEGATCTQSCNACKACTAHGAASVSSLHRQRQMQIDLMRQ